MHSLRIGALLIALALIAGCVSRTVRSVDMSPVDQAATTVPEERLLDIGIAIFEPNIPKDYEEMQRAAINPEVRRAESNYVPYVLKELLQSTGYWGAVRVVPRLTNAVDVTLLGRIDESDGAFQRLHIAAVDSSGEVWFQRDYDGEASKYAYEDSIPRNIDPFQGMYKQVAADLKTHYDKLTTAQIAQLRRISQLRFAAEMAPEAFSDYLTIKGSSVDVKRLPAPNDPLLAKVDEVRQREYAFVDTLDAHYAVFFDTMYEPYKGYRKASFEESTARRRMEDEAQRQIIAGAGAVIGGLGSIAKSNSGVGTYGGGVAIAGGGFLLKSGLTKRVLALQRGQSLLELGESLESQVAPHTIELESEVIHLSGSVNEQYATLRTALTRIYRQELGLPDIGEQVDTAPQITPQ